MAGCNFLFINPSIDIEKYGIFKYFYKPFHPISLLHVASAVKNKGHNVELIDMEYQKLNVNQVIQIIKKRQPDFLAIGVLTPAARIAEQICIGTRQVSKNTIIITGNLHSSFMAEKWICEGLCDYVVHGEGEETIIRLIDITGSKSNPASLFSISYFEKGKCISTRRGIPPMDLDALPFTDWSLINPLKYDMNALVKLGARGVPMFNARGCPYKCSFCSFDKYARIPRYRSPENIIEEIEYLIKDFGIDHIWFLEPNFGINKKYTIELLEKFISRNIHKKIKWVCGMRTDYVEKDLIRLVKKAGCARIYLGFESGVDKLLNDINKNTSVNKGKEACRIIKDEGIEAAGLFMIGLPNETKEDTVKTIKYACELNLDFAKFAITVPLPGSPLFDEYYKSGRLKRPDWNNYLTFTTHPDGLVNINRFQSSKELVRNLFLAHLKFYLRPRQIKKVLFSLLFKNN